MTGSTPPLLAALLIVAGPADATGSAQRVLAAAKAATGGAAWDRPQGCIEQGSHGDGAVRYRTEFSLHRYGLRIDSDRGGQEQSMGFNGTVRWQTAPDGGVRVLSDAAARAEGIVTTYLSINGFFFPDRYPARVRYRRAAREGSRQFDVLTVHPDGGRPLELWFDRRTHLIQRVIDTLGTPAVRVEASDYRTVDRLTVAYRLDVFGPDGRVVDRGAVTSFQCGAIDSSRFDPPTGG